MLLHLVNGSLPRARDTHQALLWSPRTLQWADRTWSPRTALARC